MSQTSKTADPSLKPQENSSKNDLRDSLAPIVAVTSLALFVIFSVHMVRISSTSDENQWNRNLYIFAAAEAIAFGAAGFFFGSEVQRKTLEKAEAKIQKVEELAERVQDEATKGHALRKAINALPSPIPQASALGLSGDNAPANQQEQIQYIKDLADSIYK